MKINEMFEWTPNGYGRRLVDKMFINLWQTSNSIEELEEKEINLWNEYRAYLEQYGTRRAQKEAHSHPSAWGWTPAQRGAYFKKIGVPLKSMDKLKTSKQLDRAAHIEDLKVYAIEVLNAHR